MVCVWCWFWKSISRPFWLDNWTLYLSLCQGAKAQIYMEQADSPSFFPWDIFQYSMPWNPSSFSKGAMFLGRFSLFSRDVQSTSGTHQHGTTCTAKIGNLCPDAVGLTQSMRWSSYMVLLRYVLTVKEKEIASELLQKAKHKYTKQGPYRMPLPWKLIARLFPGWCSILV